MFRNGFLTVVPTSGRALWHGINYSAAVNSFQCRFPLTDNLFAHEVMKSRIFRDGGEHSRGAVIGFRENELAIDLFLR